MLLYEHVRPRSPVLGTLADLISPLTRRLLGPELNRATERNVETAGLRITAVRRRGIWHEITATPDIREHQPRRFLERLRHPHPGGYQCRLPAGGEEDVGEQGPRRRR